MTNGYSRPFSPSGTASLVPALPLKFAGDLMLVHFRTDPDAIARYIPSPLEPVGSGEAFLWTSRLNCHSIDVAPAEINPARTFYNVCVIGLPAMLEGKPTLFSAFQWGDRDWLLALSWFLGACSKMASIEQTGTHPMYGHLGSPAHSGLGSAVRRTVSRHGERIVDLTITPEKSIEIDALNFYFDNLPLTCMRHIPNLSVPRGKKPLLHDLTQMMMSDVAFGEPMAGAAKLDFGNADNEELIPLQPLETLGGFIAPMAFMLDGVNTVHNYLGGK